MTSRASAPTRDRFRTILVDPPWSYRSAGQNGAAAGKYPTLRQADLASLPVDDVAADDDAVLLLWATWPFIEQALELIEAWGFEYVTAMPWIKIVGTPIVGTSTTTFKPQYGVGHWLRGCSEVVLIAKRPGGKSYRSQYVGLLSENAGHSRKPDSLHEYAETALPGPYLELFARRKRPGWTVLGNEAPGDGQDIRTSLVALVERGRA